MSAVAQPDAPTSTAPRRSRLPVLAGSVAFVVLGTLVQLPRQSGIYMWRTVWAEDGARFYVDALARPWRANVLESYAGYAHVVPRTLASIGVQLPAEWWSVWVTVTAAFSASLLALFVYFASAPLLRSPVRQSILAVALLLWPVLPYEITGTITNIQWTMPVACLLAVLFPVERFWAIVPRLVVVVLAPLSSPLCVLFAPIALWQIVMVLRRRNGFVRLVVPVVYGVAAVVQLAVFATSPQAPGDKPPLAEFGRDIAKLYGTKVAGELFLGVRSAEWVWDGIGYGMAALAVVVLVAAVAWRFARASSTARWFIAACVVASVSIFTVSIWQRSSVIPNMLLAAGQDYNFAGLRYQLFPAALLLLTLLVPLDLPASAFTEVTTPAPRPLGEEVRTQRGALVVAAVWFLVAFLPSYRVTTARSIGPDWIAEVDRTELSCRASSDPEAAAILSVSPEPSWVFVVSCVDLEEGG